MPDSRFPKRILVASERPSRHRITRLVLDLGLEAISVGNGFRMLECLMDRARPPDVIVASPTIPGCSGALLLDLLERLELATPVVFVIGPESEARQLAWSKALTGAFFEPFDEDQLSAFIDLVADQRIADQVRTARCAAWRS